MALRWHEVFALLLCFFAASAMIYIAVTPSAIAWLLSLPVPVMTGFTTLCLLASLVMARYREKR